MLVKLLTSPIVINATLFQVTWFSCVIGSAKQLIWPAIISCLALMIWQLAPSRRHISDLKLVAIAIFLGIIIDSLWVQIGFFDYTDQRPITSLAPAWIIILWVGFALTVNHSLAWLKAHPILPFLMGFIGGPSSYFAGQKLGAVTYMADTLTVSLSLAIAWALSLVILFRISLVLSEQKT